MLLIFARMFVSYLKNIANKKNANKTMEVTFTIPTWLLWVIGIPFGIIILFVFVIGLVLCCKLIFKS